MLYWCNRGTTRQQKFTVTIDTFVSLSIVIWLVLEVCSARRVTLSSIILTRWSRHVGLFRQLHHTMINLRTRVIDFQISECRRKREAETHRVLTALLMDLYEVIMQLLLQKIRDDEYSIAIRKLRWRQVLTYVFNANLCFEHKCMNDFCFKSLAAAPMKKKTTDLGSRVIMGILRHRSPPCA